MDSLITSQEPIIEKPILLWVGDDYRSKSGYGRVAKELFPYLYRDYKVVQYAIACNGPSDEYYMIDSQDGTNFGFNKLPNVINVVNPKIIILLNDSSIVHGWLMSIHNNATIDKECMILPYVCTEYTGVPETEILLYNKICSGLLAMAQFTIDEFNNNGSLLKSYRLSHGYANNIKKNDKSIAKQRMNIPEDTFVFFSGSKNQPRKRLDIIIRAFVHLLTKHADKKVLLMFNCGLVDMGWNLKELYIRLCKENNIKNIEKYIYFCSNNIGDSNKNDQELTNIYNAADVGITTSTGESFGLIPFEQSALGVPQIIPNWGGIVESVPYGSIKVDTNDYYVYPVVIQSCNGEARTVYYKDVADAMETYLLDESLYKQHCIDVVKNIENHSWEDIYNELTSFIHSMSEEKMIRIRENPLLTDIINKCITPNFINENKITIILTCTVNVNLGKSHLIQTSPTERTNVYIKSILQWLNNTTFNIIVIENSGYKFEELYAETEKYKDRFEIITFNENTEEKAQYLKNNNSKGDSELFSINYAFNNSNLIHSSNFIIKVTGRYFIPTLEDYLLEFNLNEYDSLTQNNRIRCEMVGCHYTQFLNIFNTDIDDIHKNVIGYSYTGEVEHIFNYRTSKSKNLHCNEFQIENTQRGGINEMINSI